MILWIPKQTPGGWSLYSVTISGTLVVVILTLLVAIVLFTWRMLL